MIHALQAHQVWIGERWPVYGPYGDVAGVLDAAEERGHELDGIVRRRADGTRSITMDSLQRLQLLLSIEQAAA